MLVVIVVPDYVSIKNSKNLAGSVAPGYVNTGVAVMLVVNVAQGYVSIKSSKTPAMNAV